MPVSSAIGMKVRQKQAALWMLPSRQHLEADRLSTVEIDDRLKVGNDVAGGDGATDLGFELNPLP
jgi:hypothetical protein